MILLKVTYIAFNAKHVFQCMHSLGIEPSAFGLQTPRSTVWTTGMTKWSDAPMLPDGPENSYKTPQMHTEGLESHLQSRRSENRIYTADLID